MSQGFFCALCSLVATLVSRAELLRTGGGDLVVEGQLLVLAFLLWSELLQAADGSDLGVAGQISWHTRW